MLKKMITLLIHHLQPTPNETTTPEATDTPIPTDSPTPFPVEEYIEEELISEE